MSVADMSVVVVNTTPIALDTFNASVYRSVKYMAQITDSMGESQFAEILSTHNGIDDAQIKVTTTNMTNNSLTVVNFSAFVSGGFFSLVAESTVPNTIVKLNKTYFSP